MSHGLRTTALFAPDGTKLSILEIDGVEVTTSALGAYAGLLNATDFPIQILIRQHAPQMQSMVEGMIARRPDYLTDKVLEAAHSLDELLLGVEHREGLVDRRFYVICAQEHIELLAGGVASLRDVGLLLLQGERLKKLLASLAIGSSLRPWSTTRRSSLSTSTASFCRWVSSTEAAWFCPSGPGP